MYYVPTHHENTICCYQKKKLSKHSKILDVKDEIKYTYCTVKHVERSGFFFLVLLACLLNF